MNFVRSLVISYIDVARRYIRYKNWHTLWGDLILWMKVEYKSRSETLIYYTDENNKLFNHSSSTVDVLFVQDEHNSERRD